MVFKENSFIENKTNTFFKLIANKIQNPKNKSNDFSNLEIISDQQTSQNDILVVEGNVLARNEKLSLTADKLIFNQKENKLFIKGNIIIQSDDQFLEASMVI